MNSADEAKLAWDLIDAAIPFLDQARRTSICARIGGDEATRAIADALYAFVVAGVAMPAELATRTHEWLDCYIGGPDEPKLRRLLQTAACPE